MDADTAAMPPAETGPQAEAWGPQAEAWGPQPETEGPQSEAGGPQAETGGPQSETGGPQAETGGPQSETGGPQAEGGGPTAWPRIADYWPDAATGPRRPLRQPPALPLPPPPPAPPTRWARPVIGTAVVALLLAGAAITGHRFLARPTAARPSTAVAPPPVRTSTNPAVGPATVRPEPSASPSSRVKAPPPPPPVVTRAPPPARPAAASFELASDLTEISIGTARLDSGIARVTTASGGAVPKLRLDGTSAKLTVTARGDQRTKVAVVLDDRIVWTLRIDGGSRTTRIDLTGAAVARIDLTGGAHEIDLALPRLRSALPVLMSGGVHTWRISTAGRVPVRLVARKGAGDVELYGDDRGGLGEGVRVDTTAGSDGPLDLDAVGGIGSLEVTGA